MPLILHLVLNDYVHDNRVRRAAETGALLGNRVVLFALHRTPLPRREDHGALRVLRFALTTRSWSKIKPVQLLKYLEAALRMIRRGIVLRPDLVHAHDADTLPIGWMIARCTGARLVYDAHELWCDPHRISYLPPWISRMVVQIERRLAGRSATVITVSDHIARYMRLRLRILSPLVVRNMPERWGKPTPLRLRTALSIPSTSLIFLYQGVIAGEGVHLLLDAFLRLGGNCHLVYLGNGSDVTALQCRAESAPLMRQRIHFHEAVSAEDLPFFTADADVGVLSIAGHSLSYSWSLPNKLFESIQGGLAIIASRRPEMADVLRNHQCGLTFSTWDCAALTRCMQTLVNDPVQLDSLRKASNRAARTLCWENERMALCEIYKRLIRMDNPQHPTKRSSRQP